MLSTEKSREQTRRVSAADTGQGIELSKLAINPETESEYIEAMSKLKENQLIKKGCLFFTLPWAILGLFAGYLPWVYAVMPVHESDLCICGFYQVQD